jgi:hypothetical protein
MAYLLIKRYSEIKGCFEEVFLYPCVISHVSLRIKESRLKCLYVCLKLECSATFLRALGLQFKYCYHKLKVADLICTCSEVVFATSSTSFPSIWSPTVLFFFFLYFYLGPEEIKMIPFDIIFKIWCFKNTNIYYHKIESF